MSVDPDIPQQPFPGGAGTARRRMTRNTALRAVTEVLVKLASFVLVAALARTVGASSFGEYMFALAVTQVLFAFAGLGLDRMLTRDIARDHAAVDRLFWDTLMMKLAALAVGLALSFGVLALLGESLRVLALVGVLGAGVALAFAIQSTYSVFQAHERMEYFVYVGLPAGVLNVAFGLAGLALGLGALGVALGALLASAVVGVFSFALMLRVFARPELVVRPGTWPGIVREAAPFGLQEILGQLIFRFDTLLLGVLAASTAVGAYGAAYRLLEAALFISWSIGSAALPMFSYLPGRGEPAPEGSATLPEVYAAALRLVLTLTAPIGVGLFVCAPAVIEVVYGDEFADAAGLLRILAVALVLYGVGHVAGILVLVRRAPRTSIAYNGGVAAGNVVLCAVLIPPLEATGAAIATVVCEGALAVAGVLLARRVAGVPDPRTWLVVPLVASAAMALAIVPLADRLVLAGLAGGAAYVLVLLALGGRNLLREARTLRAGTAGAPA
jgi:O-antigen/teichoic acid export membrane protein